MEIDASMNTIHVKYVIQPTGIWSKHSHLKSELLFHVKHRI